MLILFWHILKFTGKFQKCLKSAAAIKSKSGNSKHTNTLEAILKQTLNNSSGLHSSYWLALNLHSVILGHAVGMATNSFGPNFLAHKPLASRLFRELIGPNNRELFVHVHMLVIRYMHLHRTNNVHF